MCEQLPATFTQFRVPTGLAFHTVQHDGGGMTRAEQALLRDDDRLRPVGWAPLAAYEPPGVGVRFLVAGGRRRRLFEGCRRRQALHPGSAANGQVCTASPPAAHPEPMMPRQHVSSTHLIFRVPSVTLTPLIPRDGRFWWLELDSSCTRCDAALGRPLAGCAHALSRLPSAVAVVPIDDPSHRCVATPATASLAACPPPRQQSPHCPRIHPGTRVALTLSSPPSASHPSSHPAGATPAPPMLPRMDLPALPRPLTT